MTPLPPPPLCLLAIIDKLREDPNIRYGLQYSHGFYLLVYYGHRSTFAPIAIVHANTNANFRNHYGCLTIDISDPTSLAQLSPKVKPATAEGHKPTPQPAISNDKSKTE